ncbi:MAG: hypothetical protein ACW98I_19535 [Candidatus Hodarchaeales archaeon]
MFPLFHPTIPIYLLNFLIGNNSMFIPCYLGPKLSLIDGKGGAALNLLEQAKAFSEKRGLNKLALQVNEEYNVLTIEIDNWEKLFKNNAPFRDRIMKAKLDEYSTALLDFSPFTFSSKKEEEDLIRKGVL